MVNGYLWVFPRDKAGHSHLVLKVKNEWSYTSTAPTSLHVVDTDMFLTYAPKTKRYVLLLVIWTACTLACHSKFRLPAVRGKCVLHKAQISASES
jgi:hypothetical protein